MKKKYKKVKKTKRYKRVIKKKVKKVKKHKRVIKKKIKKVKKYKRVIKLLKKIEKSKKVIKYTRKLKKEELKKKRLKKLKREIKLLKQKLKKLERQQKEIIKRRKYKVEKKKRERLRKLREKYIRLRKLPTGWVYMRDVFMYYYFVDFPNLQFSKGTRRVLRLFRYSKHPFFKLLSLEPKLSKTFINSKKRYAIYYILHLNYTKDGEKLDDYIVKRMIWKVGRGKKMIDIVKKLLNEREDINITDAENLLLKIYAGSKANVVEIIGVEIL